MAAPTDPPAPALGPRPHRRHRRLALAVPTAALLTLTGAGSTLAAPSDPGGTSGGSDLTRLFTPTDG